ncbi:hypothetical protein VB715_18630 [Crocosphaera sp. UHCC 0190]|uniref:hypothetical protein n=1 Tax=Crocosphaera sp. UHCC 0190 TaxID=3110246 RepID=UPI002B20E39F|nr:hypothetical protein [Crocosphaera sp. UHCC 0190]MEA5511792.1 hypothetical protein [Crocosphaera sp. UHCC 0190]
MSEIIAHSHSEQTSQGSLIKIENTEALELTKAHYQIMTAFVKGQMKENTDYGIIPGTNGKPTLLKPGAEKLCRLLNLRPTFQLISSIVDFEKPTFYYHYQCSLYHNSELVGQGDGSCNSYEKKYRYRKAELTCPSCGQPTVIKGKAEYGGGYVCYKKKGGCGAKFRDDDEEITSQAVGLIENPDIFDQVNTIQKMAEKRALIAAVLCTVGASEFFTQDLEDMDFDESPQKTRIFKNVTPNQTQSSSNNLPGKSQKDWFELGKKDALLGEEMKYPKVKPYTDGYFEGEKQKKLNELEQDIEF